ncbi:hypothetical protein SUGI_0232510 [Cryptomeria japonica]|nr:hypothetical protein SUGI_0232510 [Cryptomeria japonica]
MPSHRIFLLISAHCHYLRIGGLEGFQKNLFTTVRGLCILDMSWTRISTLPMSVGKMILLKVLNLRGTRIYEVPEFVRHLRNLLFLAISNHCTELLLWIIELPCLQHLGCQGVNCMPKGKSKLASLKPLDDQAFGKSEGFPHLRFFIVALKILEDGALEWLRRLKMFSY